MFGIRAKYLYPKRQFVFDMVREILLTSVWKMKNGCGKSSPASRDVCRPPFRQRGICRGYPGALLSVSGFRVRGADGGDHYYRLVEELESHFEERKEEIIRNLKLLMNICSVRKILPSALQRKKKG